MAFDLASVVFLVRWERLASIRYAGSALPSLPSAALLAFSSACSFPSIPLWAGARRMVTVLSRFNEVVIRYFCEFLHILYVEWSVEDVECPDSFRASVESQPLYVHQS